MGILVGLVAGAVVSAVLWVGLRGTFAAPVFQRTNYRGAAIPVGAGVILALVGVVAMAAHQGGRAVAVDRGWIETGDWFNYASYLGLGGTLAVLDGPVTGEPFVMVTVAAVAFALLGLFDDLGASGTERGFRGHLGAMLRGRLTTGGVKLVFGGLVALGLAAQRSGVPPFGIVLDGLLIALAANLGNLFDRAPGRTTKVAILAAAPLLTLHPGAALHPVSVVIGAAAGLLVFDLREELMLGDAGANVLGGVLGLGVVMTCSASTRIVVVLILLALNLASEKVSFSKVIDKVPPLRFVDRLGRRV